MMTPMKVDKLSVSFEPDLGDAVRSAAAQAGKPVSSWLAEAAASKLRAEALAEFLSGWEAEHGVLTAEEPDTCAQDCERYEAAIGADRRLSARLFHGPLSHRVIALVATGRSAWPRWADPAGHRRC